jgi:regulator of RNase E activity RraA
MPALARETIDRLKLVSTATLTTQLFKRGLRNAFMQGVRPLGRYHGNLVGPAFTLRNIPAREDVDNVGVFSNPEHPQRKAIEITPEGHVLVIDCRGDTRAACAGEILVTRLMMRGVAGLVGDGGIRDAGPIGDWHNSRCSAPARARRSTWRSITPWRATCRSVAAASRSLQMMSSSAIAMASR